MSFSRGGSVLQPLNQFYSEDSAVSKPSKTLPTPATVKTLTRVSSAAAATKNGKKPAAGGKPKPKPTKQSVKKPTKPVVTKKKPLTTAGKKKKKANGSEKQWHILTPQ